MLTGEGADELFLGYNRYRVTALERAARAGSTGRWLPAAVRRRQFARARGRAARGRSRRYAERTFLALEPGPARALLRELRRLPARACSGELLADRALLAARDPYAEALALLRRGAGRHPATRMSHADLQTYLVELLMKQDQMSMAASIESRVPFLDHELVEHVAAMPGALQAPRLADQGRPAGGAAGTWCRREILTRRKMGFPVPVGTLAARGRSGRVVDESRPGPARSRPRPLRPEAALRRLARGASRGRGASRRSPLAPHQPRDLAARSSSTARTPRPCCGRPERDAHPLGQGGGALAARYAAAGCGAFTSSPSCRGGTGSRVLTTHGPGDDAAARRRRCRDCERVRRLPHRPRQAGERGLRPGAGALVALPACRSTSGQGARARPRRGRLAPDRRGRRSTSASRTSWPRRRTCRSAGACRRSSSSTTSST